MAGILGAAASPGRACPSDLGRVVLAEVARGFSTALGVAIPAPGGHTFAGSVAGHPCGVKRLRGRLLGSPSEVRAVTDGRSSAQGSEPIAACDLRWGDIDLAHRVIRIRASKTGAGIRDVHVTDALRAELIRHRAERPGTPAAFVLTTKLGTQQTRQNVNRRVLNPR